MPSSDRRATADVVVTGPGIHYETFLGIQWAGAALSLIFVAIRLASRSRGQGRFFWDDFFALSAAALILVTASLWQWEARDMYYVLNLQAGLVLPEADFSIRLMRELKVSFMSQLFFYTALFCIKLALIIFFGRLGNKVSGQKYVRWPALILSAVCYFVSVGDMGFQCLINSDITYLRTYCVSKEFAKKMSAAVAANCVLDIVSDIAITIIPFTLLWNVRIDARKKLAFFGLFSLTLITIAAAMARAIETETTKKENGVHDTSYVWMWGTIQASLAVIVSCLSAFPQLFAASTRKTKPKWTPTETYYQRLRSRLQKQQARSTDPLYNMSSVTIPDQDQKNPSYTNSYENQEPVLSPDMGQNNATCAAVTYPSSTVQDQITQQVEYRVEFGDQVGAVHRWPIEYQQMHASYYAGYPAPQQMR